MILFILIFRLILQFWSFSLRHQLWLKLLMTVRGEEAVVVLSAKTFANLLPLMVQHSLHALLSQLPLSHLDFEQTSIQPPVWDVNL